MKFIPLALLLAFGGNQHRQPTNPFLTLHFDRVIVCDFENDGEHDYPLVDEKGRLTDIVKKSAQLDATTTARLVARLGDRRSYGRPHATCFEPHFGILFYRAAKVVAEVQICLGCNVLSSTLIIPAQQQGKAGHGKEIYYNLSGMSDTFRQFINRLISKYHFSHPIAAG